MIKPFVDTGKCAKSPAAIKPRQFDEGDPVGLGARAAACAAESCRSDVGIGGIGARIRKLPV